jgi:hypothetical protein
MTPEREKKRIERAIRKVPLDALEAFIASCVTGDGLWCLIDGQPSFVPVSGGTTETL